MTIYPSGTHVEGIKYKWERAQLDPPVPESLIEKADRNEWINYISCLSPEKQLRKLGQSLDRFHEMMKVTTDPLELPEKYQVKLYSAWEAAAIVSGVIAERLMFSLPGEKQEAFKSDIEESLFYIIDFLKSVHSPDTQAWEDRLAKHNKIKNINPLLYKAHDGGFTRSNNLNTKPPRGPAA